MTGIDREWLEEVRADYGHCFGCGMENPLGMRIDGFESDGDTVTAHFSPRDEYRGFHDILHGGVIAAALDEILGWTAIIVGGHMALTAKLQIRYRNPGLAGEHYLLSGTLVEQRGRRMSLEASCVADDGTVVAEASGIFLGTEPVERG